MYSFEEETSYCEHWEPTDADRARADTAADSSAWVLQCLEWCEKSPGEIATFTHSATD